MSAAVCEETIVTPGAAPAATPYDDLLHALDRTRTSFAETPAQLASIFGLSGFELDILLLCAAAELEPTFPRLCGEALDDADRRAPTFQLALNALIDAHWSALLPQAPLRHWKLIDADTSESLTGGPLRIEEAVLHYLTGSPCLDERLGELLESVEPPSMLPSSYLEAAETLAKLGRSSHRTHVAQLKGAATEDKWTVAAAGCAAAGLRLKSVRISEFRAAMERYARADTLPRILGRDSALGGFALLIDAEDASPADAESAAQLADRFPGFVMLLGGSRFQLHSRSMTAIEIERPSSADQRALWKRALGEHGDALESDIERISARYSLDSERILKSGRQVREHLNRHAGEANGVSRVSPGRLLEHICRPDSVSALGSLAQRIDTRAGWEAIVLPDAAVDSLRAIVAQVRHQGKVLERWGFAEQTSRGLGISALFHGPSGTGKTLAAEVLAHELELELFRIDLSQVVSKYIGETEKNLRAVFEAATGSGAVLLFDEADALFGKRSEVRDSHDRYANIEVSYLLQRMEAYRGLAILTTNIRAGMDTAFLRRIRFFIGFPFPDQPARRRIWERMFPPGMPAENLDFDKLARLNMPGGNIRNVALNAAYIAADRNEPVRMRHLAVAARRESAKLDRAPSEAEIGGWE